MNTDLLQGKRDAQDLVASSDAPRNRIGRKKGYIDLRSWLSYGRRKATRILV